MVSLILVLILPMGSMNLPYCGVNPTNGVHEFNKLDSELCQDASICISTFLNWWFLRRYCPYINKSKNSFPYYGTTQPSGTMILGNLILDYIRKLPCRLSDSESGSREDIWILSYMYINTCKNSFHYCGPIQSPWGLWFSQTCSWTMSETFHSNFSFSDPMVLEKKNL
jgi:hypothetical protein